VPQPENFDAIWDGETPRRSTAPQPEPSPPPPESPASAAAPIAPSPAQPAEPKAAQSPTILKSGVVDGMAYTLYTDGSIEARLPQGTVKFASVAELRAHIESNS
jgi:hypothetical protein